MFNKLESSINIMANPCSIVGLVSIKDRKGKTYIIQRELITHTEEETFYSEAERETRIYLSTGKVIIIELSGEEVAKLILATDN